MCFFAWLCFFILLFGNKNLILCLSCICLKGETNFFFLATHSTLYQIAALNLSTSMCREEKKNRTYYTPDAIQIVSWSSVVWVAATVFEPNRGSKKKPKTFSAAAHYYSKFSFYSHSKSNTDSFLCAKLFKFNCEKNFSPSNCVETKFSHKRKFFYAFLMDWLQSAAMNGTLIAFN